MRKTRIIGSATVRTHPSLALIKYWGKLDSKRNLPATPSIAVGLAELTCTTHVEIHALGGAVEDTVIVNRSPQDPARFADFFRALRTMTLAEGREEPFSIHAQSELNFPPSAGLASSSAGFAALSLACIQALGMNTGQASALARTGSASAARAVFGGFTLLSAGAKTAVPLFDSGFWPDLRIIVVEVTKSPKSISSREAMERCRKESPLYPAWVDDAPTLAAMARNALEKRDLSILGPLIRQSSMRMFAVMLSVQEPIRYWEPGTLHILDLLETLRKEGLGVWETMDAGPQVKIVCEKKDAMTLVKRIEHSMPDFLVRICTVAPEPGGI